MAFVQYWLKFEMIGSILVVYKVWTTEKQNKRKHVNNKKDKRKENSLADRKYSFYYNRQYAHCVKGYKQLNIYIYFLDGGSTYMVQLIWQTIYN